MFWALGAITAFLSYLVFVAKVRNLLLSLLCSFSYLAITFWAIIDPTSPFNNFTNGWNTITVTIMGAMSFVPVIYHMTIEVQREKDGHRWAERMNKEQLARMNKKPSPYEAHFNMLQANIARQKQNRRRR